MADDDRMWDTEGDVVWLIGLATEPIMKGLDEVMAKLDKVIRSKNTRTEKCQNKCVTNDVQQG